MKPKIYFISGVCGVGKSSVIPYLKKLLPKDKYDIRDFDERGVPDDVDDNWRKAEIKNWLSIGTKLAGKGIVTIICGYIEKNDFDGLACSGTPEIELILLDADAEIIRKRLIGRYTKDGIFDETQKVIGKPVNVFIQSNVYCCNLMREEWEKDKRKIIVTSDLTPEEVAKKIVEII